MAPSIWSGRQGSLEKGEKRAKGSGQPLRSSASPSRASPVKGGNCCAKKKILSLLPGTSGFVFSGGFQVSRTVSRLHEC